MGVWRVMTKNNHPEEIRHRDSSGVWKGEQNVVLVCIQSFPRRGAFSTIGMIK